MANRFQQLTAELIELTQNPLYALDETGRVAPYVDATAVAEIANQLAAIPPPTAPTTPATEPTWINN